VNSEVWHYKRLGRASRIMALIADGEPNASDRPESGQPECFPPALRQVVAADGTLTAERAEPVAADLRHEGDGWRNAKLKLIAGILGVPFDECGSEKRSVCAGAGCKARCSRFCCWRLPPLALGQ